MTQASVAPLPDSAAATWQGDIRALEREALEAFFRVDLDALDRIFPDDFLVNSPLNVVSDKPRLLGALRAGRIRHTSYSAEIETMARYGDTVIVMGNDRVTDPPDDTISHRRYTNIWQLRDGRWVFIARHAQIVSREPNPARRGAAPND